jgi:tRNA pseudouridine synthase 10
MKRLSPDKSYRAVVVCLSPALREAIVRLRAVRDLILTQETPRRVLHRRPNLTRRRAIRECSVEFLDDAAPVRRFALTVRAQSGTYIKEFISGDEGRAHPSVSSFLAVPCDCAELDVLEVHCDPLAPR